MNETVPALKDDENQTKVPTIWRGTLKSIVNSIKNNNFLFENSKNSITPISSDDQTLIRNNINEYGEELCDLPDETWDTSACQWMLDYWELYVDLFTVNEGLSDLVLSVRIFEQEHDSYLFEIQSVHVP